jgi:DNA-directed RNA polymerase specialized sigma24 family protein
LRELVRALPEPQRDALALRYSAGLTARQIGAVIGKNEEATQKLIARALSDLKEAYGHERS